MRVFEAAGSGLENFQLIHNVVGIAKFSYDNGGMTIASNNFGLATSAATTASGVVNLTFSTKFGTVPPNVIIYANRVNTSAVGVAHVVAPASNSFQAMCLLGAHGDVTATSVMTLSLITAGAQAIAGHIFVMPYSATGTRFTTA